MARNAEQAAEAQGVTEQTAEGATEVAADAAASTDTAQGRTQIELTLDEEHAKLVGAETGSKMKRQDYIRKRWSQGVDRGPISRELTKLEGRKVPYQIVFQATKGKTKGAAVAAPAVVTEGASDEATTATEA
jgi:hypothetical protein